jgi:hypothetical protein
MRTFKAGEEVWIYEDNLVRPKKGVISTPVINLNDAYYVKTSSDERVHISYYLFHVGNKIEESEMLDNLCNGSDMLSRFYEEMKEEIEDRAEELPPTNGCTAPSQGLSAQTAGAI